MGKLVILLVALAVFSLFSLNSPTAEAGSIDPGTVSVSINDVSLEEGDVGTTDFVFTVSAVCEGPCGTFSVGYSTEADTATEDDDYNRVSDGLVTLFPSGSTASGTITIQVNGDTDFESDEIFFVNLTDCGVLFTCADFQGQGTILNDDAEPASETAYVSGSTSSSENLDNGAIGTVNFDTGDITQIGNQIVEGGLSGLTFDSNGDLFGSSVFGSGGSFIPSQLYQIDPITGEATPINDIAIFSEGTYPLKIRDLATNPVNDVIYGVGNVIEENPFGCGNFDSLFTINKEDASATCIGPLEIEGVSEATFGGIAFAPDGTLYATGNGCRDIDESCIFPNFLASFNSDASFAFFFHDLIDSPFLDGLGIRPSDGAFFGTSGEGGSVHSIDLGASTTPVAGEFDHPADITFSPFSAPVQLQTTPPGNGGEYEDPTLGKLNNGRLILSNGFCFDQFCLDVLEYFNHLPIQQVDSGSTHTISLTAYCSSGSNRCNYASVGAAPPGTDINTVQWNVALERTGTSNDWQVTKDDPKGMLGDVTGTVQIVDTSRIQYTFNIQFISPASIGTVDGNAEPPKDNLILVTEIRDNNGGAKRNIFNEGVFVNDIYAYPQAETSYMPSVKVDPLCLNEDSSDRNTCAFAKVQQWTIKQAEEKLKEIYEQNHYKKN